MALASFNADSARRASVTWSPLSGGLLTGKYHRGEIGRKEAMGGNTFQQENSPQPTAIFDTLIEVVNEAGGASGKVAIACVASKGTLPFI